MDKKYERQTDGFGMRSVYVIKEIDSQRFYCHIVDEYENEPELIGVYAVRFRGDIDTRFYPSVEHGYKYINGLKINCEGGYEMWPEYLNELYKMRPHLEHVVFEYALSLGLDVEWQRKELKQIEELLLKESQ